ELHLFAHVADLVDPAVRGAVDLDDVHGLPPGDPLAVVALVAPRPRGAMLAVEALRQKPGEGCLARTPRPGKDIGVRRPAGVEGVLQGAHHVFLADDLVETLGAPLAIKRKVSQGITSIG